MAGIEDTKETFTTAFVIKINGNVAGEIDTDSAIRFLADTLRATENDYEAAVQAVKDAVAKRVRRMA